MTRFILFLIIRQINRQNEEVQRQLAAEKQRLDSALNNMTQGLTMFDGAGRLVLCNLRYIEMTKLPREAFRMGMPMREILARRVAAGTFADDPDQHVADSIRKAAEGRAEQRTIDLGDGRTISVIFQPLRGGGWVSTHTDVTQQRTAERERDSLRQREENRHAAFGLGIHRCLGSNLARLEVRVAVQEFVRHFPRFELADPGAVRWSVGQIRGPRELPVRILDRA